MLSSGMRPPAADIGLGFWGLGIRNFVSKVCVCMHLKVLCAVVVDNSLAGISGGAFGRLGGTLVPKYLAGVEYRK